MSYQCAALFVQPDGCYSDIPDVDVWPEYRDARLYDGPYPVVAHPPCQLWGSMANVNYARWGGEHNRPGNDGGCFAAAIRSVERYGGVLEHPATFGISGRTTASCKKFKETKMSRFDEEPDGDIHGECTHEIARLENDLRELAAKTNALLHQIDIGDFVDSNGHSAKMLKPVHDLMNLLVDAKEN